MTKSQLEICRPGDFFFRADHGGLTQRTSPGWFGETQNEAFVSRIFRILILPTGNRLDWLVEKHPWGKLGAKVPTYHKRTPSPS